MCHWLIESKFNTYPPMTLLTLIDPPMTNQAKITPPSPIKQGRGVSA